MGSLVRLNKKYCFHTYRLYRGISYAGKTYAWARPTYTRQLHFYLALTIMTINLGDWGKEKQLEGLQQQQLEKFPRSTDSQILKEQGLWNSCSTKATPNFLEPKRNWPSFNAHLTWASPWHCCVTLPSLLYWLLSLWEEKRIWIVGWTLKPL